MTWAELTAAANPLIRDDFGETVTYTPSGGSGESVTATFDDGAEGVAIGTGGVPVIMPTTTIDFVISDLSQTPAEGDGLTVAGVTYTIETVVVDGQGNAHCKVLR